MKRFMLATSAALTIFISGALPANADSVVATLQTQYQTSGASAFYANAGKAAWTREVAGKNGKAQSCASCHGTDLGKEGKHMQTQKVIAAMAPSVNPKRLTDAKKVEKWLLRNCKGTWGRECTPQEKGDFLAYLGSL